MAERGNDSDDARPARTADAPWHLPGLGEPPREEMYEGLTRAGARFRTPRMLAAEAAAVARCVREAALTARQERSIEQVVRAVSTAALRLADPDDPIGRCAAATLGWELGWSDELVAETLAAMSGVWSEDALHRLIASEIGDPSVLDRFSVDEPAASGFPPVLHGRARRASGPPLLMIVHAGNVPGVAVTACIRGLLARSGVLSRASADGPSLPALFAAALAEADPTLGDTVATTWWPSDGDAPARDAWVERAGKLVVYGGADAVRAFRTRTPADRQVISYGPRTGVGVVFSDGVSEQAARGLAQDVCAYEQMGCVSPRLVWVLGDATAFGHMLAEALAAEVARVRRPAITASEAVEIRRARATAEFRSDASPEPSGAAVLGPRDLAWTVTIGDMAPAEVESLPRFVPLIPVADSGELRSRLEPLEGLIQALGYAGTEGLDTTAELAAELGISRVAPFGRVAWPPADWRHDGGFQLLPLLDWTDLERP